VSVPTVADTDLSAYDFIDLGGSKGGSLRYCSAAFGGRGVGIDLSARKVDIARERGLDIVLGDATSLELDEAVRFVSMMDFLEHLPSLDDVARAIASAARAARDFLFISHPSFEGEEHLRSAGLQQFWWSWRGHTSHITITDYRRILRDLGLSAYTVRFYEQVLHSGHPTVIPLDAPPNSSYYDEAVHGPKPFMPFSVPVWRAQRLLVALRPMSEAEWVRLLKEGAGRPTDS
jgi:hypothetical protein